MLDRSTVKWWSYFFQVIKGSFSIQHWYFPMIRCPWRRLLCCLMNYYSYKFTDPILLAFFFLLLWGLLNSSTIFTYCLKHHSRSRWILGHGKGRIKYIKPAKSHIVKIHNILGYIFKLPVTYQIKYRKILSKIFYINC